MPCDTTPEKYPNKQDLVRKPLKYGIAAATICIRPGFRIQHDKTQRFEGVVLVGSSAIIRSSLKKLIVFAALICASLAFFVSSASALTPAETVVQDCNQDSVLNGHYSRSDLQAALKLLQGDTAEYGECESVINQALSNSVTHKKSHGSGKGSGSGGPVSQVAAAKAQRTKIARQVEKDSTLDNSAPIAKVDGGAVKRASGHTLASSTAPGVPTALIVALAGMLLLFGTDLAARVAKMPQMAFLTKIIPQRWRSGPDR